MDVKSAFLNGKLKEEVYVKQPLGFHSEKYPNHVYFLDKAMYGIKQAPRAWYEWLSTFLLSHNFHRGTTDITLFYKNVHKNILLVQIYVDNIIFGSTDISPCKEFELLMQNEFEMSMMGKLIFFLGLQVKKSSEGIFINQAKYIQELLKKYKLAEVTPIRTPMASGLKLHKDLSGTSVDSKLYRDMIGSLMYLTTSRPNIMFSTCICARYQSDPKESHMHAVKRILRYLKKTPSLGLWYPLHSGFDLLAYTDSNYGGCQVDRKSTSGSCHFLGGKLVSWSSKKHNCVSTSTAEAESVTAASCCSQALWMQTQLRDYGYTFDKIPILCDNKSAIAISENPINFYILFLVLSEILQRIPSFLRSSLPTKPATLFTISSQTPAQAATSTGSATGNSENHPHDVEVNQSQAQTTHGISFQRNRFENITLVLRNHPLYFALTARVEVPETYLTQFLLSAYVCNIEDEGLSIVGYTADSKGKKMISLSMNVNDLRSTLQLEELSEYDDTPTNEEMIEFLNFLSYTPDDNLPLIKRGDFRRKGLPPLWNMLFSILNSCLNGKVATQTSARSSKSKKGDGHPPNLVLQRFFGLVFYNILKEKLPWNPSDKGSPMAKLFPFKSFKPTVQKKGYAQERPMSHAMIMLLQKEHRNAYRSSYRSPKPVPGTPLRIGKPKEHRHRKTSERDEGEKAVDSEMNEPRLPVEVESSPPQKTEKPKKKKAKKPKVVATEEPSKAQKKRSRDQTAGVSDTPVVKKAKKSKKKSQNPLYRL
ncbi:hypothetical protein OSB04_023786 [Centaurea solstitialis]|uniref:Reverse transcriptase Ty1/copia-type domain-containing protein n=1 Tax=Centaurea solstitialis TaxID=347529 RepID=A0AA38SJV7_9ASTR|nr:hypothetical protein OSB04_023786 [Centaurea solstitialis]